MKAASSLIKELRKLTGSPVVHCKTAIEETGGDIPKAIEWLRAKGLSQAHKKLNKDVSAGLLGLLEQSSRVVMMEALCETDFVAKTDQFQAFALGALKALSGASDWNPARMQEEVKAIPMLQSLDPSVKSQTIDEARLYTITKTQENVALRRVLGLRAQPNVVIGRYLHNAISDYLGASGCVLKLTSATPLADTVRPEVQSLADKLCMQAIATKPLFLKKTDVTPKYLDTERSAITEKLDEKLKQKPKELINKVVAERLNKSLEQAVLLEQTFVITEDPTEIKVKDLVRATGERLKVQLEVEDFKTMFCGEALD